MNNNKLSLHIGMGNHFHIEIENATIKITKKQFAELSEQIFQYWRITPEQVAEQSTATDALQHLHNLKEEN